MSIFAKSFFCIILIIFYSSKITAKNIWTIDKELSEFIFEVPVLFAKKVKGQFMEFDGFVVLDPENKKNNRALFSTKIIGMKLNYEKYKKLLFSNIFFDEVNFPIATIDTKKFTLKDNSNSLQINAELQIKDIVTVIPLTIKINYLTDNLVQIKTNFKFSRNNYKLGKDNWSSTLILKDTIHFKANLFLSRK